MDNLREVSKTEKILFPIVLLFYFLIVPSAGALIGCLMLGNLVKESGVVPKITETLANTLLFIVTILLGVCVGCTARCCHLLNTRHNRHLYPWYSRFLGGDQRAVSWEAKSCAGRPRARVNPMIGAAGVSAVPMAARVVHKEGGQRRSDKLLAHARDGS